jgi:acetyl-CoA carboxylase carboxyl transferase subunit beta
MPRNFERAQASASAEQATALVARRRQSSTPNGQPAPESAQPEVPSVPVPPGAESETGGPRGPQESWPRKERRANRLEDPDGAEPAAEEKAPPAAAGGKPAARRQTARKPKREIPAGLWTKCESCGQLIYHKALAENLRVCSKCEFHFPLTALDRIQLTLDPDTFQEWDAELVSVDPLQFGVPRPYPEKIAEEQRTLGMADACVTGRGRLDGQDIALGVTDSRFMMGSMGSVVGEKLTRAIERATELRLPLIIISGSGGGARMQEGVLSLMQMAKTASALMRYDEAGGLFISVLTHPTMAGVLASFATLGDVIIAEPKALIGFTGPRVIESTIRQKLPEGFQRSEFLLEHGLIDLIVHRRDMKATLARLLAHFRPAWPK